MHCFTLRTSVVSLSLGVGASKSISNYHSIVFMSFSQWLVSVVFHTITFALRCIHTSLNYANKGVQVQTSQEKSLDEFEEILDKVESSSIIHKGYVEGYFPEHPDASWNTLLSMHRDLTNYKSNLVSKGLDNIPTQDLVSFNN